jgi:hypothetical protein
MTGPQWGYAGIWLWPKKMVRTKLVAPTATFTTEGTGRGRTDLVIPFDGVYWFFKPPDQRPPRRSREAQGSPDALDIHSTDRRPLYMEAWQNFASPIDLSCCRRIQIAIRNRDRYPRTVSLELVLINAARPLERRGGPCLGECIARSAFGCAPGSDPPGLCRICPSQRVRLTSQPRCGAARSCYLPPSSRSTRPITPEMRCQFSCSTASRLIPLLVIE